MLTKEELEVVAKAARNYEPDHSVDWGKDKNGNWTRMIEKVVPGTGWPAYELASLRLRNSHNIHDRNSVTSYDRRYDIILAETDRSLLDLGSLFSPEDGNMTEYLNMLSKNPARVAEFVEQLIEEGKYIVP